MNDQGIQCSGQARASGHRPLCVVGNRGRGPLAQVVGIGHRLQSLTCELVGFWEEGVCEMLRLGGGHKAIVTSKRKGL